MTKTNDAKRKRPTYFEQIPLDVVKKIAQEDMPKKRRVLTRSLQKRRPRAPRDVRLIETGVEAFGTAVTAEGTA